jgi:hypothetical protein
MSLFVVAIFVLCFIGISFNDLQSIHQNIFSLFSFNPNIKFLGDIAVIEATFIALLIPLSIQIISKLSERYTSYIITDKFESNWEYRILPKLILINIGVVIILKFYLFDDVDTLFWRIISWILLLQFIFIAYLIYRILYFVSKFLKNPYFVMNQLYKDIEKAIK